MTLSQQERDRMYEEEWARVEARQQMKRQRWPWLASAMFVWAAILTILAHTH